MAVRHSGGGFKPEPIAIPVAATPSCMDLPLSAAGGTICVAEALDHGTFGADQGRLGGSSSIDPQAAARRQELDRLSASLVNSEIQPDELQMLHTIGHGSSGSVSQVLHVPSASVLALKSIPVDADETSRKAILLELKALHECAHPAIVSFYGAFFREGAVHIALEYMDASLLDVLRAEGAPLPEPIVAAIARPVLDGLVYLHREKHLIHRDIKPHAQHVGRALLGDAQPARLASSREGPCVQAALHTWEEWEEPRSRR